MNDSCCSDYIFVTNGTEIVPLKKQYYSYQFFSLNRPRNFIYSYDYSLDEAWLTHEPADDLAEETNQSTAFSKTGFIKIHSDFPGDFKINGITEDEYFQKQASAFLAQPEVKEEIEKTADSVAKLLKKKRLYFTLLSDTHYVLNGNWETTAATIEAVNSKIAEKTGRNPDGVIHLGDFTDGILSKSVCERFSHKVIDRILSWKVPLLVAIGNHDVNYFKKNPELLTHSAAAEMYLS